MTGRCVVALDPILATHWRTDWVWQLQGSEVNATFTLSRRKLPVFFRPKPPARTLDANRDRRDACPALWDTRRSLALIARPGGSKAVEDHWLYVKQ